VAVVKSRIPDIMPLGTIDDFLKEAWEREKKVGVFGQQTLINPYEDKEEFGRIEYDPYNNN
jgi:hypothetical protein